MVDDDSCPPGSRRDTPPTRPRSEADGPPQQEANVTNVKADAVDKLTDLNAEAEKAVKALKDRLAGPRDA